MVGSAGEGKRRRRVALLVQTTSEWHRQLLRGVADYAREHGPWDFHIEPRGLLETMQLPKGWRGDGVILRLVDHAQEQAIHRHGLPAVNVSWQGEHSRAIPRVSSDESACARLAASHFVEKGFRSFAYVGPVGQPRYADVLGAEFAIATRAAMTSRPTSPFQTSSAVGCRKPRSQPNGLAQDSGAFAQFIRWRISVGAANAAPKR